ncbi:ESPR-type extended signal peptide-containing protein [Luteimonas sp. MHLX1A]|uniref:ESPR-type extended signal peptide-containing protein n=1 Tax=Alterluteimonas muca TaxID=2878684 RepID=UPI001E5F539E|nr:ESPR-type extended signal peptide-containing protein [Luteimonas sp. MHLX1A]MCD9047548.1 YadA-like family protein [Luteimonas sp. MHLX1A]
MNRIFRRVWNSTLMQWVVASELASGHRPAGMSSTLSGLVGGARNPALPISALCIALLSAPLAAQEFTVTDGTNDAAIGPDGTVTFTGDPNIRVTQTGTDDDAVIEIQLARDIDVDLVTAGATRIDTTGVAIGPDVRLGANGLTLGAGAPSITTAGIQAGNRVISGVAAGSAVDHAVNLSQLQAVQAQAGAGWNVAVGATAYNIGPNGRVTFSGDPNLGVALNGAADAAGVALTLNRNLNVDTVTTGATVTSTAGVAVGGAVRLSSTGLTIAGGPSVTTAGINAGGSRITNVADGAVNAVSSDAVTGRQIFGLFIEEGAGGVRYFRARSAEADSQALGDESVAIGARSVAGGDSSLASGDGAVTTDGATAAIAIGQGAVVGTASATAPDGAGGVAIGRAASAAGNRTIALGDGARVASEFVADALAIGTGASVSGAQSNQATAIGFRATANAGNATALGALAAANGRGSIAIGQATANGGNAFAAGSGAQAISPNGIALGTGAGVGTRGTEAGDRTSHIAIGTGAGTNVVGNQTTAIGFQAGTGVLGDQNIAIGSQAGTAVKGDFNIAIGYRANQGAGALDRGTAIGALASASSDSAAFGYNARTTGVSAVAIGTEASAAGQGVALGRSAFAEGGSAAIGFNSRALATDGVGTSFLTGSTFGDGTVVSVGSSASNLQRRIVNVADGAQGFDAVNVNQLRAAQTATANLVGGNITVGPDGNYTGYVIELNSVDGPQRYTTVAEAIRAVSSGAVSVTPGNAVIRNADGTITTAAAVLGDQAVNLGQLNAAIDANASRYVSINSTDPANRDNSGASGTDAMAIGPQADADGDGGLSVGYRARSVGDAASALGNNVAALGDRSTAIGSSSQAYGDGTVAIGDRAVANGLNSVVIGTNAQADRKSPNDTVDNAVVIGTDAEVTADNGIAVGNSALASERNAVAQGFDAHAVAESAVATGTRARASALNAQASGTDSAASGVNSIASGTDSRGLASNGVAIGTAAVSGFAPQPGEEGLNINTIAIGNGAQAVYQDATAIGRASRASQTASTAIGDAASASEEAALALGRNANASGVSSIAQGDGAVASAEAAQAQGRGANASGVSSNAQGDGAIASEEAAQAQGRGANASGISSIAQGDRAQASATGATASGRGAQATQASATALGDDARATGINAIAAGHASRASGAASAAFGNDAQATLANTLALGAASRATAAGASAVGSDAQATVAGATALGQGTRATHANSVALGHNAVTAAAVATLNGTIDNVVYDYAGTAPVATVSVGTGTEKRTITNVAAGRVTDTSTDAINGSQLFRTNQAVNALGTNLDSLGTSTAAALGGTSTYSPTTHQVTAGLTVGGTPHTNVQDALNQVDATANAGWNVTDGDTAANIGPNGQVTFTGDNNLTVTQTGVDDGGEIEITLNKDIDLGVDGSLTMGDTVIETSGIAVGNAVKLGDTGLVIAGGPSVTTLGIDAGGQKIVNLAPGTNPTDAVNLSQLTNTINSSATRYYSVNSTGGTNLQNDGAIGADAIASGKDASAQGARSIAVGLGAQARAQPNGIPNVPGLSADNSVAIGSSAVAGNSNAVALGQSAQANRSGSIAIGSGAQTRWDGSLQSNQFSSQIAIGAGAYTGTGAGTGAMALGSGASADGGNIQTAIGSGATVRGNITTAVGAQSTANGDTVAAVGVRAQASGFDSVAFGTLATSGRNAAGASVSSASAIGVYSAAQGTGASAIGTGAFVFGNGSGSVAAINPNVARIQWAAKNDTVFSIVGGSENFAVGNRNLVGGTSSNNVAFGNDIKLGASAATFEERTVVQNGVSMRYYVPTFTDQVAITNSVAIGQSARVGASNSVAIGQNASATAANSYAGGANAVASGANAVALGNQAQAWDAGAIAVGNGAIAAGAFSIAQGQRATASTTGAIATGVNAVATGVHSIALGSNSVTQHNNSVALGASSVTADAVGTAGVTLNGTDYLFAGTTPTSTVSVGRVGEERTITNVAAGRISATSTDAINGSQLHATNTALDEVAGVANAGWNVTAEGANGSNVGVNSATGNTVDFNNSDGNIVVSKADTSNDVTFDLADDIEVDSLTAGNTVVDTTGVTVDDGAGNSTLVGAGTIDVTDATGTTTIAGNMVSVGGANPIVISGDAGTIGGLTNRTIDYPGFADGTGRAATEDQLDLVNQTANAGWNVTDAAGNTANIGPNGQVTFTGDSNLGVAQTGADDAGVVAITLNRDLDLDSVTTGNSALDSDGLAVDDGAGNSTLVGAGTISVTDAGGTTTIGGNVVSVGGANPIVISGDAGTIGGLTNQTITAPGFADGSGRAATEEQLQLVNQTANAGWNVTAQGQNGSNVAVNSTTGNNVDLNNADGNIVVTKSTTSNDVTFDLADDLEVESLTAGDTVIDTTGVAIGTDVKLGDTGLTIVGGPSVTLAGIDAGGAVITNVAAGSAPTDAVNVSQLTDTVETNRTKYYSVNSTGGGNFDNDGATGDDAIAAGKDATAEGDEAIALGIGGAAAGDGGIAIGARAQALSLNSLAIGTGAVSSHANSIALGAGSATTVGAQTGYQGAFVGSSDSTGELNVGGRQITGVAAGSAATDAVNVSQLQGGVDYAINEANSYTDGQIDGVNNRIDVIDGRVTAIEGDIIDIQGDITDIQGDIVDIRGDITDLDDRVSSVEGVVLEVGGRLDSLETGASGPFQISQGEAYVAPTPSGQNASAGGNGAVASGNNSVALGNQSQATGAGSTAVGQGAKATATNSTALGQGATASHANSVALGAGSATTVGAQSNYNGAYVGSSSSTGEVNVGGRTISGVAPGIAGTDAVNVNQLTGGVNQAINVANQYTDGRITQIQDDMWSIERGYRGATSSAMAMAGLPQAYLPGKSMLAVGVGGYQSEYGMAVGLSGVTENGRYVYRAQASGNTARDWGFSVGAGIQW